MIRRIFNGVRDWVNRGYPAKLPFDELVRRAEQTMINRNGNFPRCPYCKNEMMFRHSHIVFDRGPVRDDQGWKCVKCYHTAHFGLPVEREKAINEVDLRGSPYLSRPTYRRDEETDPAVIERLRKLGYIE